MLSPGGHAAEPTNLGWHVADLAVAVTRGLSEIMGPHGLLPVEFSLLRSCLMLGECTATQLGELVPTDPSRISRIVTKMVDAGLLTRRRVPEDRRVVMLQLTAEGEDLADRLDERAQAYYAELVEGISAADMHVFASTLDRIMANYDALDRTR